MPNQDAGFLSTEVGSVELVMLNSMQIEGYASCVCGKMPVRSRHDPYMIDLRAFSGALLVKFAGVVVKICWNVSHIVEACWRDGAARPVSAPSS